MKKVQILALLFCFVHFSVAFSAAKDPQQAASKRWWCNPKIMLPLGLLGTAAIVVSIAVPLSEDNSEPPNNFTTASPLDDSASRLLNRSQTTMTSVEEDLTTSSFIIPALTSEETTSNISKETSSPYQSTYAYTTEAYAQTSSYTPSAPTFSTRGGGPNSQTTTQTYPVTTSSPQMTTQQTRKPPCARLRGAARHKQKKRNLANKPVPPKNEEILKAYLSKKSVFALSGGEKQVWVLYFSEAYYKDKVRLSIPAIIYKGEHLKLDPEALEILAKEGQIEKKNSTAYLNKKYLEKASL